MLTFQCTLERISPTVWSKSDSLSQPWMLAGSRPENFAAFRATPTASGDPQRLPVLRDDRQYSLPDVCHLLFHCQTRIQILYHSVTASAAFFATIICWSSLPISLSPFVTVLQPTTLSDYPQRNAGDNHLALGVEIGLI